MATTLDLHLVETYKLGSIAFADISSYSGNPTNVSFEITPPGFSKINVSFTPRVVNIYNAYNLGITTDEDAVVYLPDGVYTMKYSVAPNATVYVEKSFMRVAYIESLYKRAFLQVDTGCDCNSDSKAKLKKQLRDIKLLIDGSIAATDDCDYSMATRLYKQAFLMLQNLELCECY